MSDSKQVFILVDTSYWIFYRYFAILQWWKHANPDEDLFENPYDNQEFVEKFIKTFTESLEGFKKKQKLHKQRGKPEIPCTIIACRDCPRKEIWRNALYDNYKETRDKDDSFMGGPFFKLVYNNENKMLYDSGVNHVLQFPNLEADDVLAITKKQIRQKYPEAQIIIIANDHDYLQLLDEYTDIINFQQKNLRESKKVFPESNKNLFYKIVLGDKSDNIFPIFKKCGPKTCEKYYTNKELFLEALKKDSGSQEKYELNKKLVDFNKIPENLVNGFLEEYKNIFHSF
jgi:5'-3' exonuclease